jgi:hypothetical protein
MSGEGQPSSAPVHRDLPPAGAPQWRLERPQGDHSDAARVGSTTPRYGSVGLVGDIQRRERDSKPASGAGETFTRYATLRANDAKRGRIWTRALSPLVTVSRREARGVGQKLGIKWALQVPFDVIAAAASIEPVLDSGFMRP